MRFRLEIVPRCAFFVAFSILAAGPQAYAQLETAEIAGFVTDATGGAMPNVLVQCVSRRTQVLRIVKTDNRGYYSVRPMPPGEYDLSIESTGIERFNSTTIS